MVLGLVGIGVETDGSASPSCRPKKKPGKKTKNRSNNQGPTGNSDKHDK